MGSGLDVRIIDERIRAYEGFGIHRTGWTGDDRSADWMRDILVAAGAKASVERFGFPLLEYRRRLLHYPGGQVEGLPLYDSGFTPAGGGVEGELVELGSGDPFGNIVITPENDPSFAQATIGRSIEDLEETGAVGLVVVTGDPKGAVTVLNAVRLADPRSLPVLQIGAADMRQHLASALLMHSEVRLEIDGDRLQSRARNLVATLQGTDPEAAPIGIMTPRSGWFTCAAERGGGIAILLALAEEFARRPHRRTIELVASSGHELNHWGLQAYLGARRAIESSALAWLHLGDIGTSTGPTRVETTDAGLLAQGVAALEAAGARFEVTEARGGEAQNIARAGGRYLSLRGANEYFHSANDVFDLACDAEQVAAAGRAALAVIEEWDRQ